MDISVSLAVATAASIEQEHPGAGVDMEPTQFNVIRNGGIGYQEPNVECHLADIDDDDNATLLRRLSANDNERWAISGLEVRFDDDYEDDCGYGQKHKWYNELGCAIGNSKQLRTLRIEDNASERVINSKMFLERVATNRSIEHLSLNIFGCIGMIDIIRIFAPFIAHNHNLRSIEFYAFHWNLNGINDFISLLVQSKTIRLENISLISARMGDEIAADLFNALKSMPGLCHLTNLNLEANKIGREGCKALSGLLANENTRLLCLNLSWNDIDDQCIKELTIGLMKNSTIKVLDLSYLKGVTQDGWRAFAAYLTVCSLDRLDVGGNKLGEDVTSSFGIALNLNDAIELKYLDLRGVKSVTSAGWRVLSTGLCSMAIEELHLCQADIDDEGAVSVVSAVVTTKHLKSLCMGNHSMTSAGWIQCFRLLNDSDIRLEELHLRGNNMDDEAAAIFFELLVANNTTLKSLDLSSSESISSAGWFRCFQLLLGTTSNLNTLSLDRNDIDDEGARALVDLLSENYSVSTLSLRGGHADSMSIDGWLGFRRLLQPSSTSSKLKELNLGAMDYNPTMNATYVALFALALKDTNMEVLRLFDCSDYDGDFYIPTISMQGWGTFADVMCDSSSIANVCSSNHSLNELWGSDWNSTEVIPSEIRSLLRMNRNKNKAEVVRMKLVKHYFSKASNVEQTFANFTTAMMPDAIGWVGSDRLGFSTMYRLLGSMPWLLDPKHNLIATVTEEPPAKFRKVEK